MTKKLLLFFQNYFKSAKIISGSISALLFFFFSFSSFAQGPGSPFIDAGEDVVISCEEDCAELTATYLDTGLSSEYVVSSIPYNPPFPFTGGTPVSVEIDDRWSNTINIPFDFCFFEESHDKMLIGSNGVITFDLGRYSPGGYCSWSFSSSIPSPNLFRKTIFGPYMDINPEVAGSGLINWYVDGEAPNRSMVINFPDIPYYGCNYMRLTSQVVIYETTNVVEVYIQDRPSGCYWNDGYAIIGIQDGTGTKGYTPPGRNTGDWSATNEAWRFTPSGESTVTVDWLNANGEVIGTGANITVCPDQGETTYTARAIYLNCNGEEVVVTDEVTVTKYAPFDVDLGEDQDLCDVSEYEITAEIIDGDPNQATFLWSTGETTQSITVTESGVYSVEVTISDCTVHRSIEVLLNETPDIDLGEDQNTCFEVPLVLDASPSNYEDPTVLTYKWYLNGDLIPNAAEHTLEVTEPGTYSVEVSIGACSATADIVIDQGEIEVDLGPDLEVCFEAPVILDGTPLHIDDPSLATYEWFLNGTLISGAGDPTLEVTEIGVYSVNVTFGACTASDEVVVELGTIEIDLGPDLVVCIVEPIILDATPTTGSAEDFEYEWRLNGEVIEGENSPTLEATQVGIYSVTVSNGFCIATDSMEIRPADDLDVTITMDGLEPTAGDYEICPNEPRILRARTDEEDVTYQWYLNGQAIAGATEASYELVLEPGTLTTQTYAVVIERNGCTGTYSVGVRTYPIGNCIISQGISPNNDGLNDSLDLTFLNDRTGIKKLQIFNRLGTLVFEQDNYVNQWKGQSKNGNDLPTGTYFYVIDLNGNDAVYGQQATGWIYLNR